MTKIELRAQIKARQEVEERLRGENNKYHRIHHLPAHHLIIYNGRPVEPPTHLKQKTALSGKTTGV